RLPRPDPELPGRRHADGRADRVRVAGRAGPLLRRHDPDPRGDPRDRGRPHGPRGQPAQARPAHRSAGVGERVDPRLPARAGGVPAALAQAAEILAAGGARGQRLRGQERVLLVRHDQRVQGRNRSVTRTERVLAGRAGIRGMLNGAAGCWPPMKPYSPEQPERSEIAALAGPMVLEFGTNWCGYCRAAQPLVERALADYPGVGHLKVEDGPGRVLGRSFRVKLWPTLVFLRDGQE